MKMRSRQLSLVDLPPADGRHAERGSRKEQSLQSVYGPDCESLLLNLDTSLSVHARSQMFSWTQGLLQSLVPCKVLMCALHGGDSGASKADSFSTLVGAGTSLGELLLRDPAALPSLIKTWRQHNFVPVIRELRDVPALAGSRLELELGRIGATELLIHGSRDVDTEVGSLFVFADQAGTFAEREAYLVQLIVPFLDAAWIRSQARARSEGSGCVARGGSGALTEREREILRWICHGKSNWEIGAILDISPLTVKNHVKKILRKLNVVNRAQAVGKALDARIISP